MRDLANTQEEVTLGLTSGNNGWGRTSSRHLGAVLALLIATGPGIAQTVTNASEIHSERIAENFFLVRGSSGSNIGVLIGEEGVVLVDGSYAKLTDKIVAAVHELSETPIRFVFNTHFHEDHTSGNENLSKQGAVVIAHQNVYDRLSVDQVLHRIESAPKSIPASPRAAWPTRTFENENTLNLNGEEIYALHTPQAHTDGDSIIHFRKTNVVLMGDLLLPKRYPSIDWPAGGRFEGLVQALTSALALMNEKTVIVPGHGPLLGPKDLEAQRNALREIGGAVTQLVKQGMSLDEIRREQPLARWTRAWKQSDTAERRLLETIYRGVRESE